MTTCSLSPALGPANYWGSRASQPAVPSSSERPTSAAITASAALAAQMTETNALLTVTTEDGDRVTLSYSAKSLQAALQYDSGSGEAGEAVLAAKETGLSMSVEGSLDQEEVSDLARLFRKFARALRDLFRGNPERAMERMSRTRGLDSLASFDYSMSHQSQAVARSLQQTG